MRNIVKYYKTLQQKAPKPLDNILRLLGEQLGKVYIFWIKYFSRFFFYVSRGHFVRKLITDRYLDRNSKKMLQIGGGRHMKKGWLNTDIIDGDIYIDATRKFPLPDRSFDYIFAEQFIEHLTKEEGKDFLMESCRVLKTKGKIRLSTPDLEKMIRVYEGESMPAISEKVIKRHNKNHGRNLTTMAEFFNDMYRLWGHRFIYDHQTLKMLLKKAGFKNIKRVAFGKSSDKNLKNLERHADSEWMRNGFTLIVEAQK
jgi:predicted SAM-dependent methyltransferase